jgi:hypothetical protein
MEVEGWVKVDSEFVRKEEEEEDEYNKIKRWW